MDRLAATHPEAAPALAARYAGRAYLPRPDQQELAARVRRLVARHRGRSTSGTRSRFVAGPRQQGLGPGIAAVSAEPQAQVQLPLIP